MSVSPFIRPGNAARPSHETNAPGARPAGLRTALPGPPAPLRDRRMLGQILLDDGAVDAGDLFKAVVIQNREQAPLGDILLGHGWVTEAALSHALSRQWRTRCVDLNQTPPDSRLIDALGAETCLIHGIVPWRHVGGVTFIATSRPDAFAALASLWPPRFGTIRMVLCTATEARESVLNSRRTQLARRAEQRVPLHLSARSRNEGRASLLAAVVLLAALAGLALAPIGVIAALTGWAVLTLIGSMILKVASLREVFAKASAPVTPSAEFRGKLPMISVMVPLFREPEIADRLVGRLSRLTYPRELTDILLVVEESDHITRDALARATLPRWLRVVAVPDGPVKTKPRALNYALNFCKGGIVGVWDAEDRPEADQLHKVARRFADAPDDVACLQGVLDYYNPRTNWLARAFTIEYASWFRTNLPGVERLGLVVPLGGTTLFFRRALLERVGGWDAWNVTEDADLGVRLARLGLRTEMLGTVTHEEANCRMVPWVKQRSRWLKGFMMTWGVHMRAPRRLIAEIGPRAFLGVQVQFLCAVSQYLFAPVLWSFWLLAFGLPHPLRPVLAGMWGGWAVTALFTLFVASELLNMAAAFWATRGAQHRHLWPFVPTMHLYFPLGCLAAWKALYEVVVKPYYWDKTTHGIFDHGAEDQPGARLHAAGETVAALPVQAALIPFLGTITDEPRAAPLGDGMVASARPTAGPAVASPESVPVVIAPSLLIGAEAAALRAAGPPANHSLPVTSVIGS